MKRFGIFSVLFATTAMQAAGGHHGTGGSSAAAIAAEAAREIKKIAAATPAPVEEARLALEKLRKVYNKENCKAAKETLRTLFSFGGLYEAYYDDLWKELNKTRKNATAKFLRETIVQAKAAVDRYERARTKKNFSLAQKKVHDGILYNDIPGQPLPVNMQQLRDHWHAIATSPLDAEKQGERNLLDMQQQRGG
jgi:hypothetical protein